MSLDFVQQLVKSGKGNKNNQATPMEISMTQGEKSDVYVVFSLPDHATYTRTTGFLPQSRIQILHKSQLYPKCSCMSYVVF